MKFLVFSTSEHNFANLGEKDVEEITTLDELLNYVRSVGPVIISETEEWPSNHRRLALFSMEIYDDYRE